MTKNRSEHASRRHRHRTVIGAWRDLRRPASIVLVVLCLLAGVAERALAQAVSQSGRTISGPSVQTNTATKPLVMLLSPVAATQPVPSEQWTTLRLQQRQELQWAAHWPPDPSLHNLPAEGQQPSDLPPDTDERFASCSSAYSDAGESRERYLQLLPDGLLYKSYLAGEKEPRFASVWLYEKGRGWIWETALGGRVGLLRYGTAGAVAPEGWQLDLEGAVFPRIDPILRSEMDSVDMRAGIISTWRFGPTAFKAGYYHISSHVGDEFLLRNPSFVRIEYVRDSAIAGITHNLNDDTAVYGEIGYAIGSLGGAKPLEFQFGAQYSPAVANGLRGAPFAAVNGHLREDFGFGGNVNIVAGWQWRGAESDRLLRAGFQYYNGKSLQYQFFDKDEELLGLGLWFDY